MYDALLTLRGWGAAEFREFSPELHAAARWALFAEKVAPLLVGERMAQSVNLHGLTPEAKLDAVGPKVRAGQNISVLESILYPRDDDDD